MQTLLESQSDRYNNDIPTDHCSIACKIWSIRCLIILQTEKQLLSALCSSRREQIYRAARSQDFTNSHSHPRLFSLARRPQSPTNALSILRYPSHVIYELCSLSETTSWSIFRIHAPIEPLLDVSAKVCLAIAATLTGTLRAVGTALALYPCSRTGWHMIVLQ